MAQQYYTLEEAAQKLGIPVDELRDMAKKKEIRAFQDKGNWRFRSQEIDERARQMGAGSEAEMSLGEARRPAPVDDDVVPIGRENPAGSRSGRTPKTPAPKASSDSDVRLVFDDAHDIKLDSDVKLGGPKSSARRGADSGVKLDKQESDSDVKLVEEGKKSPSDSDIRLHDPAKSGKKKGTTANVITEEIDLDAEEAKAKAKPSKPIKPRPGTQFNPDMPVLPTSSPYELSDSDLSLDDSAVKSGRKLRSTLDDDSSDHEMIAFDTDKARADLGSGDIPLLADSGEVDLAELPVPNAGNSGINLKDAADGGISLEDGGSDELEFELSLDSGNTPKPQKKAAEPATSMEDSSSEFELSMDDDSGSDVGSSSEFELSIDDGGADSSQNLENSDSEFELTLDEDGGLAVEDSGKDIFEETNFDVPALDDSGSEAVSLDDNTDLEGSSEFDISLDADAGTGTGSQVVSVDEEEADDASATVAQTRNKPAAKPKAKPAAKKAVADEEDEPGLDFDEANEEPAAKKGGKKNPPTVDEDEEDEDEDLRAPAAAAAPAEWGPLPALLLFPTVIVLFLVGIMGFELIQGMWGYHRSTKVGRPVIDNIARLFDDKLPKE